MGKEGALGTVRQDTESLSSLLDELETMQEKDKGFHKMRKVLVLEEYSELERGLKLMHGMLQDGVRRDTSSTVDDRIVAGGRPLRKAVLRSIDHLTVLLQTGQ
eukprot:NODE_3663_length_392_cov_172.401487_g3634_i0.p1 GENE.NODE_3663_length_392_cov_172.401487_g3634_i0~~NODE_3663_length_392_cov_172.401487_g3634_i0.p1  ORF type:complete len:103 (+),score=8.75 NODE_3663_length_392_cov_172.401487_g3634_i0:33-341(+)